MRRTVVHLFLVALLPVLLLAPAAKSVADAIIRSNAMLASTIAEIFVDERTVTVDFEVGVNDLPAFANLLPDQIYERLGNTPVLFEERFPKFFVEDFRLLTDNGDLLIGRVVAMGPKQRVQRDAVTGEPLPVDEDDAETVLNIQLAYDLPGKPSRLSIMLGPVIQKAGIGFVAYHKKVAVNDFRYLSGVQTLLLDWGDPWYTQFITRSLRRSYFAPMSGFIYVEPYEVRKEIIVRPKDLQYWIDLGIEGREVIPVEIQEQMKLKVGAFLGDRLPVVIDGKAVAGELAHINFLDRSLKTSLVINPPRELPIDAAIMGAIFVYSTVEPLPQRVTMTWDLFNEKINRVPASTIDQAGPLPTFLEPDFAVLEWKNFLTNPELPTLIPIVSPPDMVARIAYYLRWVMGAFALGFMTRLIIVFRREEGATTAAVWSVLFSVITVAGWWVSQTAVITDAKAQTIVSGLLHNVYRAFDFRAEEQIYDVLDQSVTGDLLAEIYLDTRRGLELVNQGGARAKVKSIELIDVNIRAGQNGGFMAESTWNVNGSVGHWGHIHERRNQYRAILNIQPVSGEWKLTGLDIQEEVRL